MLIVRISGIQIKSNATPNFIEIKNGHQKTTKKVKHYYFKRNPMPRAYDKRVIYIRTDYDKSNKWIQRVADKARLIVMKGFIY